MSGLPQQKMAAVLIQCMTRTGSGYRFFRQPAALAAESLGRLLSPVVAR
jgi:hypothetical protein